MKRQKWRILACAFAVLVAFGLAVSPALLADPGGGTTQQAQYNTIDQNSPAPDSAVPILDTSPPRDLGANNMATGNLVTSDTSAQISAENNSKINSSFDNAPAPANSERLALGPELAQKVVIALNGLSVNNMRAAPANLKGGNCYGAELVIGRTYLL